jgi:hypothetical protein
VGKRSRRERRIHQQERAVATGDIAALGALVDKNATTAVPALVRALEALPTDPSKAAELDALALRLAKQLRQAGDPAHAITVAAAGRRRSAAWGMEEALAAFALGRDEIAAEVAAADASVAAAIGPLLQAVRGEVAAASPAAPSLRALHAAARAAAHLVRGEPDKARAVVRRVPQADRKAVLAEEIAGASEPVPPARLLRARMLAAGSPGAVAEIVREVGPDAFDAGDRASAALYHGFSLLRSKPGLAARSFDRAVQLGADLIETLRGKMIVADGAAMSVHELDIGADQVMRAAATAAERLAHALERVPLGGPLAAAAGALGAQRWIDAGNASHALAAITRARPLAGGRLLDELALMEADAIGFRNLGEAERLLDALLARSPGYVAAWKLKSDLALAQHDAARAEAIILEAAAVTKDPGLLEAARDIEGAYGKLVPFAGLIPGAASAGDLAKELARATTAKLDAYPLAAAHREALGPAARLAFDAAAIAVAANFDSEDMAVQRLTEVVLDWRHAPHDLARLIGVALFADLGGVVPIAALALIEDYKALRAVVNALAVAGEGKLMGRVLPSLAPSLNRRELSFFKAIAEERKRAVIAGVPDPEEAVREIDLALAPELGLADILDSADEGPPSGPARAMLSTPGEGEMLGSFLEMLGLPTDVTRTLPRETLLEIEERMLALSHGSPTPGRMIELLKLFDELGIALPDVPEPRAKKKKR